MMYPYNGCQDCFTKSHFTASDGIAARNARRSFAGIVSNKGFSDVDAANAEIVFGELCGNIARHAPGRVDIAVDCRSRQAILHVLDRGGGFSTLGRPPSDAFAEQGRGLFIVALLTVQFTVSTRPGGGSHARAVLVGNCSVCYTHRACRNTPKPNGEGFDAFRESRLLAAIHRKRTGTWNNQITEFA